MKSQRSGPVRYVYLDTVGIDSLYSQIVETVDTEITITKQAGRKSNISAKATLGKAIASVFGLPELGTAANVTAISDKIEMAKAYRSAEQKLAILLEHLNKQGEPMFFVDLHRATTHCSKEDLPTFVCIRDKFDITAYKQTGMSAEEFINKDGAIVFEKHSQSQPQMGTKASSVSEEAFSLTMAASLMKCPEVRNGILGVTSHLAIMFRSLGGIALPLRVFGSLVYCPLINFT